jgi:hypothetical protein
MGELAGTEDFEEEQAYADRLDAAVQKLCTCGAPTLHLPSQHVERIGLVHGE